MRIIDTSCLGSPTDHPTVDLTAKPSEPFRMEYLRGGDHRPGQMSVEKIRAEYTLTSGQWSLTGITVTGHHVNKNGQVGGRSAYQFFDNRRVPDFHKPVNHAPPDVLEWANRMNPGNFGAA